MADEGFFARLMNLWRGMFASWIGKKEEGNPEAVYEAANVEKKLMTFPMLGHVTLLFGRQKWFAKHADKHFSNAHSQSSIADPK